MPIGRRGVSFYIGGPTDIIEPPSLADRAAACERPLQPVVMRQSWRDLLFLHWPIEVERIAETLPPGLSVDTHEGIAYIGLVPFFMQKVRPRFCPAVPGISNFLELNVRTYVFDEMKRPGVWFYSLDANQWLAVEVAKRFFHLPYIHAKMSALREGEKIRYSSEQRDGAWSAKTSVSYTPGACLQQPEPGSLDYFLLERYLLFSWNPQSQQLYSGKVHHDPYSAREVLVEDLAARALDSAGMTPTDANRPVHEVFSPGVDVEVFPLTRVGLE